MSTYEGGDAAFEVLDHGGHELKLLLAELRHEWIGCLLLVSVWVSEGGSAMLEVSDHDNLRDDGTDTVR